MNIEEILKEITDENGNIPSDRVTSLIEKFKGFNEGLEKNKNQILEEKKRLQDKIKLYEGIASPEELEKMKTQLEEMKEKEASKSNDAETIKRMLTEKHNKEIEALRKENNEFKEKYINKMINETMTAELEKAGVTNPELRKAVLSMFGKDAKVIDDNVLVGDKAVSDFIKDWSQSDGAKAFITQPTSTGGGQKNPGGVINTENDPMLAGFMAGANLKK